MAGIDPGTRSPGKVALVYSYPEETHKCAVNYIDSVDITALTAVRADANALADVVKTILPASATIGSWEVHGPTGMVLYSEPFTPAIAGTNAFAGAAYRSLTVTLSGNGQPTTLTGSKGKTRFVLFPRSGFPTTPGAKQYPVGTSGAAWVALSTLFHTNLRFFADFYGQHAEPKSYITTQFNARAQRRVGN